MTPAFSFDYFENCHRADIEFFGKAYASKSSYTLFVGIPYFFDLLFRQYAIPVVRSFFYSIFIFSIFHVVDLSSNKKMFWINARRCVTLMQNIHSFFYFTVREFIRKSVGVFLFFNSISMIRYNSVAFCVTASPQPARRSFFDIFPETIFYRDLFTHSNSIVLFGDKVNGSI